MAGDCINLKDLVGDKWRVGYEDSYEAEYGENARTSDPWLMIALCRHGHLFPWGDDLLAASTDKRGPVAQRLMALNCGTIRQDGDDGAMITFHVDDIAQVAKILKPRRRRRLSDEQKAKLAAASARYRFSAGAQAPETALESPGAPQPDSEHLSGAAAVLGV